MILIMINESHLFYVWIKAPVILSLYFSYLKIISFDPTLHSRYCPIFMLLLTARFLEVVICHCYVFLISHSFFNRQQSNSISNSSLWLLSPKTSMLPNSKTKFSFSFLNMTSVPSLTLMLYCPWLLHHFYSLLLRHILLTFYLLSGNFSQCLLLALTPL